MRIQNDLRTLSPWLEARGFTANLVPGLQAKLTKSLGKLRMKAIDDAVLIISTLESRSES